MGTYILSSLIVKLRSIKFITINTFPIGPRTKEGGLTKEQ